MQDVAKGCRNLQLDDCSRGTRVDPNAPKIFGVGAAGMQAITEQLLRINNPAIEGKPEEKKSRKMFEAGA